MRILWISRFAPYDKIAHAGGKIHNFLLKNCNKKYGNCHLISFLDNHEYKYLDLKEYNITYNIYIDKKKFFLREKLLQMLFFITKFLGLAPIWCIWYIFRNCLIYKKKNDNPDIVILQWTSIVNQIPWLKKIFFKSKFICIEEDVTFLKKKRILDNSNILKKFFKYPFFQIFKKNELHSLHVSDLIVLNNEKDRDLIVKEGINSNKTFVCHPFFHNMQQIRNKHIGKDILFYGAMSRPENYQSAIWFIENVFPKLEPLGYRFVVLGNKPHESLKKFDNGKSICVTGFVDDITPYFENSLCLVAPLVLGAGIKIKILEAMSSGLPVLTNEIGIEGINAVNERDYFFCKTPEDYERRILGFSENPDVGIKMDSMAKKFVKEQFNYERDAEIFFTRLQELVGRKS